MAIPNSEILRARELLQAAERPLFFHDDDPDGICSFALLYKLCGQGSSVCVKNSPCLGEEYFRKVEERGADLIVVLDKPDISEEFLEQTRLPILWIDHHEPKQHANNFQNLTYLNPRLHDDEDNRPTSFWAYEIAQQGLWIAAVGTVGDWFLPPFIDKVEERYPELLPGEFSTVEELYLGTPLGELVRVLQFNLKGSTSDVRKSIMTLTRIDHPDEILKQTSSRGRFLWKKYRRLAAPYEVLLNQAIDYATAHADDPILCFIYQNDEQTFTAELSNELLIRYPERVIIVGRHHDAKYKCSLRSKDVEIPSRLNAALKGLNGRGGGHTNACGAVVAERDWDEFYSRFHSSLK